MTDRNSRWSDLLRRGMRGDSAAYGAFLADITPVIRGIVRARTGGAEDGEDVVQEVLLAVHAKRHTWREDEPVTPVVADDDGFAERRLLDTGAIALKIEGTEAAHGKSP